uniref:Uncharacterized protein n=1 Tax=Tetradesmus obliquus TaxID=3088 RepID=A0A383W5B3_TETOB
MNHWAVYDVGELLTGCLRRLQRRQGQQHHASQQRDTLQRELRELFGGARRRYLTQVLQLQAAAAAAAAGQLQMPGASVYEGMTLRTLEGLVSEWAAAAGDGNVGSDVRLQLAAAYLVVAHKWLVKQQAAAAAAAAAGGRSAPGPAGFVSDDDSSGDESSEDDEDGGWQDWFKEEEETEGQLQQQYGWSKGKEVSRLVRLCFQWVVHRELAELADELGG